MSGAFFCIFMAFTVAQVMRGAGGGAPPRRARPSQCNTTQRNATPTQRSVTAPHPTALRLTAPHSTSTQRSAAPRNATPARAQACGHTQTLATSIPTAKGLGNVSVRACACSSVCLSNASLRIRGLRSRLVHACIPVQSAFARRIGMPAIWILPLADAVHACPLRTHQSVSIHSLRHCTACSPSRASPSHCSSRRLGPSSPWSSEPARTHTHARTRARSCAGRRERV